MINETSLIRQSLKDIWCTILGVDEVSTQDDFFKVSGDSLSALVAIEQIKQRLGWDINLGDFLAYPTIDTLIQNKIKKKIYTTDRIVIRMSQRGNSTPCVLIHTFDGMIHAYSRLVTYIGNSYRCYGLQSPCLTGQTVPGSIKEMTEYYSEIIYEEFGDDEIDIIGLSFGGILGLEIAKIAEDKNLNLRKLVLIDSFFDEIPQKPGENEILLNFYQSLIEQISPDKIKESKVNEISDAQIVFSELTYAFFGQMPDQKEHNHFTIAMDLFEVYKQNIYALMNYEFEPDQIPYLALSSRDYSNKWLGIAHEIRSYLDNSD